MLNLSANESRTIVLEEPAAGSMVSDKVRVKRNRASCNVQEKKVRKQLAML